MADLCACGNAAAPGAALCARCEDLAVLGLDYRANRTDIDATWRMLAKVWHPDRFANDERLQRAAEEKLKTINAAHAALIASEQRQQVPTPQPPSRQSEPKRERARTDDARPRSQRIGLPVWFTRACVLVLLLVALAAVVKVTDVWLLAQPGLGSVYAPWRANLLRTVEVNWNRTWGSWHTGTSSPAPAPDPAPLSEPRHASASHAAPIPHVRGTQPYVTVGLTREEVEAVLGPPTSATADRLTYGSSVIGLLDGRVAGWRIAPASPLRVKLWAHQPAAAGVTTFTTGSTRDEVIALQGTPSLLSARELDYGRSEVYFENDRVIGWKNDRSSIPLKVPTP